MGARHLAGFVFRARREKTTDLLVALFHDGGSDIHRTILDTIDVITSDESLTPIQAAELITTVKAD